MPLPDRGEDYFLSGPVINAENVAIMFEATGLAKKTRRSLITMKKKRIRWISV